MRLLLLLAALAPLPAAAQRMHGTPPQDAQTQLPPNRQPPATTVMVEPVGMMIAAFDADGDGRVTRAEFDRGLRHSFDAFDRAHTGYLGYIAFADWAERWLGDRNALPSPFEVDRDGDNRITFAELADRFDLFFQRFDKNKDGVIDRSELLTVRASPGMQGRDGMRGGRRGGWQGGSQGRPDGE